MLVVKIFLASSIKEFNGARQSLKSYISTLNDDYHDRGVYFKLVLCENLSSAVSVNRKQDEYNEEIRGSQYVYFLIGHTAGRFTREEFDVAWEQLKENEESDLHEPNIHTFFLRLPEGASYDDSAVAFKDYIDYELSHYHSEFSDIDTVKLDITLELLRNPNIGGELKLRDGVVYINQRKGFSVKEASFYRCNTAIDECRAELEKANERFALLRAASLANPEDENLLDELADIINRRKSLLDEIRQMENSMLETMAFVAEKGRVGTQLNWREKKAMALVNEGDFAGANALLRDTLWDNEIDHAEAIGETATARIDEYISGKRLLVHNLMSMGMNHKAEKEVCALYERLDSLAEKWQTSLIVLCEHAEFLYRQRHYSEAIAIGKRCELRYQLAIDTKPEHFVRLFNTLGRCLYYTHNYREAARYLRQAADRLRGLSAKEPAAYRPQLAELCNFLASVFGKMKRFEERDEYVNEAVNIGELLYSQDAITYGQLLANSYNRIAIYNNGANRLDVAEDYHMKALAIRERLSVQDPVENERCLAETYNNLGFLLKKVARFDEAEAFYQKCLAIRRRRAEDDPSQFEPGVALTCTNYAILLREVGRLDESVAHLREALAIRTRLWRLDPAYASKGVAITSKQLAITLLASGDIDSVKEAQKLFCDSIEIYEELAGHEPEANAEGLSEAEASYADLLDRIGLTDEAEKEYSTALVKMRKYAPRKGSREDLVLAEIEEAYGDFLVRHQRLDEAFSLYTEAGEIVGKLAESNPAAYSDRAGSLKEKAALTKAL